MAAILLPFIPPAVTPGQHRCIFCRVPLTGESDENAGGMLDRTGSSYCRAAEDRFHMCHCPSCHCGGECPEHSESEE